MMAEDDQPQPRDAEIGALWERVGSKGLYFSGTITLDGRTVKIVLFPAKKTERGPALRIFKARFSQDSPT